MPAMSELKKDMAILKKQGFNLIKLQEHWMLDEPAEGRYDFSRYEELIAHAATLDLGIYLGLTCEQAPHWLYLKHPDCRMVGRNGLPLAHEAATTLPGDGKPGPCFDHPGALADQNRFITRLVQTLGQFKNIVIWNTWQEIAYWSEGLVGQQICYCPHTLAHFHRWLRKSNRDLDALNRAWNTRYADWSDITPDRGTRITPSAVEVAWRTFMDNVQIAAVLKARAATIRAADPLKRPVFAHKGGPVIGSGQDWTYARCQDFLGSSTYPAWGCLNGMDDGAKRPFERHTALLGELWEGVALRFDYIRSANVPGAPVWAAEFQGGPVSTGFHKGRVPSPDDIRRWMLAAIGAGVNAISFWVTRAEIMSSEMNGFSLLDSEGDTTPRLAEAGRIGKALNRHPELFGKPTLPQAKVAILIDETNYQYCSCVTDAGSNLNFSVRGWYRLLWDAGMAVDFVEASQLNDKRTGRYKALIFPFPYALSETTATSLTRLVKQGVHLVCEAVPGRVDANAFCNRGELSPLMRKLFGVSQRSLALVREPEGGTRWSPPERTWGEYLEPALLTGTGPLVGHELRANFYLETFVTDKGTVPCLTYGDAVAGVVRKTGKGSAWLLGTFAGHGGTAYRNEASQACIRAILQQCGIKPAHTGKLLMAKRVTAHQEAWLFTNPHPDAVTDPVSVKGWKKVEDLLGNPITRTGDSVELTVNSLDIRVLVVHR